MEASLPFVCLNQDFIKIFKIARIIFHLANLVNLNKILVQTTKGAGSSHRLVYRFRAIKHTLVPYPI